MQWDKYGLVELGLGRWPLAGRGLQSNCGIDSTSCRVTEPDRVSTSGTLRVVIGLLRMIIPVASDSQRLLGGVGEGGSGR